MMMSPHTKPPATGCHGGSMSVPKTSRHGGRPRTERAKQPADHVWSRGLNTKATSCSVCLGSVLFVKEAAKCQGESQTNSLFTISVSQEEAVKWQ